MGHYGGRGTMAADGDRELARLRFVVVFCVSIVRKLLPRGEIAREQKILPVAGINIPRHSTYLRTYLLVGQISGSLWRPLNPYLRAS